MSMNKATVELAAVIKSLEVDNVTRKAIANRFFLTLPDKRVIRSKFLGACGVTRTTRNILNPDAGEFEIPYDTPLACDPGSETYHSM